MANSEKCPQNPCQSNKRIRHSPPASHSTLCFFFIYISPFEQYIISFLASVSWTVYYSNCVQRLVMSSVVINWTGHKIKWTITTKTIKYKKRRRRKPKDVFHSLFSRAGSFLLHSLALPRTRLLPPPLLRAFRSHSVSLAPPRGAPVSRHRPPRQSTFKKSS